MTSLRFLGAAQEVTGSCHLLEHRGAQLLLDCGLFQGGREAYLKNLRALDFEVKRIHAVLLSHAHLDHCGLLPRLAALGFRGPVYATPATCDLARVILLDAAHIQEKEAEWLNRHHHSRHARRGYEQAPLYTVAQAQAVLAQLVPVNYGEVISPAEGVSVRMHDAGHILGSAILDITLDTPAGARRLVYSGDLGQPGRPVLRDPERIAQADWLMVESTYGNRVHKPLEATLDELVTVLEEHLPMGNVIIPSFAVGRTQEILFVLARLARERRLGKLKVHVDSPMAVTATEITLRHRELLDAETLELIEWQRTHHEAPSVHFVATVEESMALNEVQRGAIIVSASGMCEAGRIKYHLQHNLPRKECAVVMVGFQAAGTLGRRLVDGARRVTLFGQPVPVRARVHTIGGLSAHADRDALLGWLAGFEHAPRHTFVVHGEGRTAAEFAEAVSARFGWTGVSVPQAGQHIELE